MLLKNKLFIFAAAMISLAGCKDDTNKNDVAQQVPEVNAIKLEIKDVPIQFESSARAQGSKETEVRARVGGILLKRNYIEGSEVKEGSVLFQIDPEPFKVTLSKAKANLAQIDAQLKAAETQWKRIDELFKERIVSEKARDDARATLDSLRANYQQAQAEVDAAQLNLDYTTVRAPISGMTSMETQSEGSLISAVGDASLLTSITQLDPIYVIFSASDSDILNMTRMIDLGLVKNHNDAGKVTARIIQGDGTKYNHDGTVNFINPSIDEKTGTVKLRAVFPNPEKRLRPGQFLRLVIEGIIRANSIVVPQEAVMQSGSGSFVYRVNSQGVVESAQIRTGMATPDGGWIVDEGLQPGDIVITEGIMKIRPGMTVKPNIQNKIAEPQENVARKDQVTTQDNVAPKENVAQQGQVVPLDKVAPEDEVVPQDIATPVE